MAIINYAEKHGDKYLCVQKVQCFCVCGSVNVHIKSELCRVFKLNLY